MNSVLSLIGLIKKAGRLEIGEEPVGAACRNRQAKVVLLAADAASNTVRRAAHFGEAGRVLWLTVPFTKAELGRIAGRASCAMMAVTDTGLAAALVKKLAASDPDAYGPAAEQLSGRAAKALERQREQQTHKKNIRHGKKRSWAPHPDKK